VIDPAAASLTVFQHELVGLVLQHDLAVLFVAGALQDAPVAALAAARRNPIFATSARVGRIAGK
jgi:hypothetical protein